MNSVRGSIASLRAWKIRREWKNAIAGLGVGLGLVTSSPASTLRVPDELPHGPGAGMPLLTTRVSLAAATAPTSPAVVPPLVSGRTQWQLPLAFQPADANAPADAGFMARGPGYTVFLGSGGALLALQRSRSTDPSVEQHVVPRSRREPIATSGTWRRCA
jgi:hypothetical protein